MNKKLKYIVTGSIGAVCLYQSMYHDVILRKYKLKSNKVKNDIKIIVISDLHNSVYGKKQKKIIDMIKRENPNIIIYAGDCVDEQLNFKPLDMLLDGLKEYLSYYIIGNHEISADVMKQVKVLLKKYSVTLLSNRTKEILIDDTIINITGIDDIYSFRDIKHEKYEDRFDKYKGKENFDEMLSKLNKKMDKDNFSVLVSHRPCFMDLFKGLDYDLILTGHTHGGQWRIPFLLNGVFTPEEHFFPKYAGGIYDIDDDKHMIIGRGLVKNSIPRFFNPPEIVSISLIKD